MGMLDKRQGRRGWPAIGGGVLVGLALCLPMPYAAADKATAPVAADGALAFPGAQGWADRKSVV